jgi:flagellar biosynthesis/type III secretory pathway protein FliH
MTSSTKFRFETSFDNGARAVATAAERAHSTAIDTATANGEAHGFDRGYEQAMGEIAAQTQILLARLSTDMQVLYDTLDGIKRQLVADGTIVATATGSAIGGRLMEKLPTERIGQLVEELINDVIDTPRLVVRVPPTLLDSARGAIDTITQSHGFSGRLIFLCEETYKIGDVTIEWAHGGLTFATLEQQQRVQSSAQAFVDSVLSGGDLANNIEVAS